MQAAETTMQHQTADLEAYIQGLTEGARVAAKSMALASSGKKNLALGYAAAALLQQQKPLLSANLTDVQAAEKKGLDPAFLDRLLLNPERIAAMAEGLQQVAQLADPVGAISGLTQQPSGIRVGKMRVPLGVIGMIYESRPNVTADAAGLCLKSGNAVVLRCGSEALQSSLLIGECMQLGLEQAGLPRAAVQVIKNTDRAAVGYLLTSTGRVDLIIPRGGKSLIERVSNESRIPVLKHLDGNCHVYIDQYADLDKAHAIAINAKTRRYGVCGAMETLLIHAAVAEKVLPDLVQAYTQKGVELRGCELSCKLQDKIKPADESDWYTEYLAPILAIRVVTDLQSAIAHIEQYGSHHTDAIVTDNLSHAQSFLQSVDSSSVMVNASTAFADGAEYGLGAEIGISTDKLHARGPVGLEGLTSQKYIVYGDGHIRS